MKLVEIIMMACVCVFLFFRILGHLILYLNFQRRIEKKPYQEDYSCFEAKQIGVQTGHFPSQNNLLCSYLFQKRTEEEAEEVVVLAKGHGCFSVDYKDMIIQLTERGYAVFTYDVAGTGNSEGRAPGGYQQWVIDLEAALKKVSAKYQDIYLLGHSIGGYAATAVLQITKVPIRAVAVASSINSGTEYAKYLHDCIPCIFTKQVWIVMRNYEKKNFGQYAEYTGVSGINSTDVPVLVIHSKEDKMVPLKCSIVGYEKQVTNSASRVLSLDRGKHELLKYEKVRLEVTEFFQKHTYN